MQLKSKNINLTCGPNNGGWSIVLIELSCKAIKKKWNFKQQLEFIKTKSLILDINEKTVINTGITYTKMRYKIKNFGLIDSIILTMSKIEKAEILTGDRHFNDFDNIQFLK